MEKNEKSLFDDLIASDEFEAILPDDQVDTPASEDEGTTEDTREEAGNNPPDDTEDSPEIDDAAKDASDDADTTESEEADDRAIALFNFLKEEELVDVEEFSGKPSDLVEILDSLPETLFYKAVQSVHADGQSLLSYALELGQDASYEKLKTFFEQYVEPEVSLDTEDAAEAYLKQALKGNKLFKTEDKINKYIDDLIEKGELVSTAQELEAEKSAARKAAQEEEIAKTKAAREQARIETEKYFESLYETVQSQPWADKRKEAVLDALIPQKVAELNQLIQKSPKAVVQLADIYSRFNPKTGEFDLSDLELKSASKKVVEKKEALIKDRAGSILSNITTKSGKSGKTDKSFWTAFEKE